MQDIEIFVNLYGFYCHKGASVFHKPSCLNSIYNPTWVTLNMTTGGVQIIERNSRFFNYFETKTKKNTLNKTCIYETRMPPAATKSKYGKNL